MTHPRVPLCNFDGKHLRNQKSTKTRNIAHKSLLPELLSALDGLGYWHCSTFGEEVMYVDLTREKLEDLYKE